MWAHDVMGCYPGDDVVGASFDRFGCDFDRPWS